LKQKSSPVPLFAMAVPTVVPHGWIGAFTSPWATLPVPIPVSFSVLPAATANGVPVFAQTSPEALAWYAPTAATTPQTSVGTSTGSCATLPATRPLLPTAVPSAAAPPALWFTQRLSRAELNAPTRFTESPQAFSGASIGTCTTLPVTAPLEPAVTAFAPAPTAWCGMP
jgi:hypothetical protein